MLRLLSTWLPGGVPNVGGNGSVVFPRVTPLHQFNFCRLSPSSSHTHCAEDDDALLVPCVVASGLLFPSRCSGWERAVLSVIVAMARAEIVTRPQLLCLRPHQVPASVFDEGADLLLHGEARSPSAKPGILAHINNYNDD